jgi:hypothetical protein
MIGGFVRVFLPLCRGRPFHGDPQRYGAPWRRFHGASQLFGVQLSASLYSI